VVLDFLEILRPEAGQAGAVQLGVATDAMMHAGTERLARRAVVPLLGILVADPLGWAGPTLAFSHHQP
jgi:hypothetical protein